MLDGLSAVHERKIVHRDLKASNIFLALGHPERRYFVKILDFGVSKRLDSKRAPITDTGTLLGTLRHMAPEQAAGAKEIDRRADIYATGLILYEMLAGKNPFKDLPIDEQSPYVPRPIKPLRSFDPSIPRSIEDVIAIALAHEPVDRFDNALAMRTALGNAMKRAELTEAMSAPPLRGTDLRIPRLKTTV
jgi:serine/threonine protein kinase